MHLNEMQTWTAGQKQLCGYTRRSVGWIW